MSFLAGLYDPVEERLHEASSGRYVSDGNPPSALSAVYDYEALAETVEDFKSFANGNTLSRFLPLLPLREGFRIDSSDLRLSPLDFCDHPQLGTIGRKDETSQPGGSLWDRAVVVALSRESSRSDPIFLVSAGDPSVHSLNHFIEMTDMEAYCLLEDNLETSRVVFDSRKCIRWSNSTFDNPHQKIYELSERYHLVPARPGWNPYYGEGIKTVAYELAEQLEDTSGRIYVHSPSDFITPYLRKGFRELRTLGWFNTTPEVIRVRFSFEAESSSDGLQFKIPDARHLKLSREFLQKCRSRWSEQGASFSDWPRMDQIALAGAERDHEDRKPEVPIIVLSIGEPGEGENNRLDSRIVRTFEGSLESLPDTLFDRKDEKQ